MIDHVMLRVRDLEASKRFYDAVLGTLGYKCVVTFEQYRGYGENWPHFWIGADKANPHPRTHVAFMAKNRAAVDAFHASALELGAKSDGEPGPRPQYSEHYYGAFVLDPDGNNVEAVCKTPAARAKAGRKATPTRQKARKAAPSGGKAGKASAGSKKAAPARKPARRGR